MPMVDGKEYAYTPKGMAAAKAASKGGATKTASSTKGVCSINGPNGNKPISSGVA